jgi:hypothetical protein
MKRIVPKGCIIHGIDLDGKGGANVGFRCDDDLGQKWYPAKGGGGRNYPSVQLRKVSSVRHGDMTASGACRVGFTLIPRHVICRRSGPEIVCETKK